MDQFEAIESYGVFISNPSAQCAIWAQRAQPAPDSPVIWDYHVIVLARTGPPRPPGSVQSWQTWDVDSVGVFPAPLQRYLATSFRPLADAYGYLAPRFRLIPRAVYLTDFDSDRRHMTDEDGSWREEPPSWPVIGRGNTSFDAWRTMAAEDPAVLDLTGLLRWSTTSTRAADFS